MTTNNPNQSAPSIAGRVPISGTKERAAVPHRAGQPAPSAKDVLDGILRRIRRLGARRR
jgi:hypothetical protein